MHEGYEELDRLISAGLRNEPGLTPKAMHNVRERLLASAANQTMLPVVPAPARQPGLPGMIFNLIGGWVYALVYEETCYDRARVLPERTIAHDRVFMHSFDRYMFMRPAF